MANYQIPDDKRVELKADDWITITDPDGGPDDVPVYDGELSGAGARLIDGAYRGTTEVEIPGKELTDTVEISLTVQAEKATAERELTDDEVALGVKSTAQRRAITGRAIAAAGKYEGGVEADGPEFD